MKKFFWIAISFALVTFVGCDTDPLDVNVSDITVDVKIERFDKDIQNIKIFDSVSFNKLKSKYGYFLDVFGNVVLHQSTANPNYINVLHNFVNDPVLKEVNQKIDATFTVSEIENLKIELEEAFKYYKYYYPENSIPKIITYNSTFDYAVSSLDSALAVGLELYLGAEYDGYDKQQFPKYKSNKMDKKYVARDCMRALFVHNLYPYVANKKDLLEQMIYNGKVLYFLDAMFPNKSDAWKISYTDEELGWCEASEKVVWSHLIEKEALYVTNINHNAKYIDDAPFTKGMPQSSPGRVGVWVGWQIVKKYMQKYPKTTLHELMSEQNAQKILAKSGYKPS